MGAKQASPIRHVDPAGRTLTEILIEAGSIRFKPILLTALAAMIGAAIILADPIFQGLAISLLFGLASSSQLSTGCCGRDGRPVQLSSASGRYQHVATGGAQHMAGDAAQKGL